MTRLLLLSLLSFLSHLTTPLFVMFDREVTAKSLVLLVGGLFLMFKSTKEIHHKMDEGGELDASLRGKTATLGAIVLQIMIIDVVFSLDSVVTAVGMASHLPIMVAANVLALGIMLVVSGQISAFVDRHPSIKVLALSFLLMIGLVLVADACGLHIPKGYVYFAMSFSLFVETINIRTSRKPASAQSKGERE